MRRPSYLPSFPRSGHERPDEQGTEGRAHGTAVPTATRRRRGALAKALRHEWDSIQKVATGKRAVTPALAPRVTRFAGVPVHELLAGRWLSPRVCPHCGHPPDDFTDEETVVDRGRREVGD
jgi:hypothetical protein